MAERRQPKQVQARQTRPNRDRRARRRRRRGIPTPVLIISVLVLVLALVDLGLAVRRSMGRHAQEAAEQEAAEAAASARVSFAAVGDNLISGDGEYNVNILDLADSWAGEEGDGEYDFTPLFANIKKEISGYDIAFIAQESTLGGEDSGFDYAGYPTYNTPDALAEAIADAGFDVVNCNSNHTFDMGEEAIEHSQEVWAKQKDVTVIGSYTSQKDRSNIRVLERNGIKVAFLSYCYGQNAYEDAEMPNDYMAVGFDKDAITDEVEKAEELADAVVVYMHWGDDFTHELSAEQKEYATFLAGLDVDLVIGSNSFVIQPVEYVGKGIRTTDGSGTDDSNGMLCVYGLGSPINGYTQPTTSVAGMFTCDFARNKKGDVVIENPTWHAMVEHGEDGVETCYLLKDYTAKLAAKNDLLARVGEQDTATGDKEDGEESGEDANDVNDANDPIAYAKNLTTSIVGDAIEVEA